MLTREHLLSIDEAELRREVLVPLFKAMGFRDVFEHHGHALEQGKDIVMWAQDPLGRRLNYAVVAKAKPISGQASGKGSAGEVCMQAHQCFGAPYIDPHGHRQPVDRVIVVCPHQVKKEALAALEGGLGERRTAVQVLAGDQLWEQIELHLSDRTLLARAHDLKSQLAKSGLHDAAFVVSHEHVQVQMQSTEPIKATFRFPDDEAGRAALRALQEHFDAGTPVTIVREHIEAFQLPEAMERVIGGSPPTKIEIVSAVTPKLLLDLEVSSHVATIRYDNIPFDGVGGHERLTLESSQHALPFTLRLSFVRSERRFNATLVFKPEGRNVRQQLNALRLQQALAAGGVCRIEFSETGQVLAETGIESGLFTVSDETIELAAKVLAIQETTGALLSVPPTIARDDLEMIDILTDLIAGRPAKRKIDGITITLKAEGAKLLLTNAGAPMPLRMESSDEWELLGVLLPLGKVLRSIEGLELTEADALRIESADRAGSVEGMTISLRAGRGGAVETIRVVKWMPPDERAALQLTE